MSNERKHFFKCDRCPNEETMKHGDQPTGWSSVWVVKPILMSPTESDRGKIELCNVCTDAVIDFLYRDANG